jgi:anti-sigma regulatory factor (Ser/Thr protein kinase)
MCHTAELTLPGTAESVARARHWLTDQLAAIYAGPGAVADDTVLVLSELATNCVQTDARQFTVTIDAHREHLVVSALDEAAGEPVVRPTGSRDASGRGLVIVEALVQSWGVRRADSGGKAVWAELAVPAAAALRFPCSIDNRELESSPR